MSKLGSAGASSPPDTGTGGGGGDTGGILGFFSNFFTYGKEQDIIRTGGDLQKFFQPGKYRPEGNTDIIIIGVLVVILLVLLFIFRK